MTIAQRISRALKRDGFPGIALRTASRTLRVLGSGAQAWSVGLQNTLSKKATLKKYGGLLTKNERFRDYYHGHRCFVIGNGPSLSSQDLIPLAKEITFVTNSFHLHPIIGDAWQPSFYCLSDPAFFDGHEPISTFNEITSRITEALFFVPHHAFEFLDQTRALPPERTYYIATCQDIETGYSQKPDLTKAAPGAQTVVQLAITSALYMGCSPIYLLGLDHDWLAHGGNHLNFYSKEKVEDQPDGNLPGWTYQAMMDAVSTMWKIYELQKKIAAVSGIRIINATRGGFLDVFERANYEEVIADKILDA